MKEFLSKIKFEYLFAVLILGFLMGAYFFSCDATLQDKILAAVIAGFSMILTFLFTKTVPQQSSQNKPPDTAVETLPETPMVKSNAVDAKENEQVTDP